MSMTRLKSSAGHLVHDVPPRTVARQCGATERVWPGRPRKRELSSHAVVTLLRWRRCVRELHTRLFVLSVPVD